LQKIIQDPYSAAMGGFSKVTHFLRDTLLTADAPAYYEANNDVIATDTSSDVTSAIAVNTSAEAGFEIVTAVITVNLLEMGFQIHTRSFMTRCID
jgi:hypothetical protein